MRKNRDRFLTSLRKYSMICLSIIGFTFDVASQTIEGTIYDAAGNGIPDVTVAVQLPQDIQIIHYAFSDTSGHYTLSYKGSQDTIVLKIFGLTIESQSKKIPVANQKIDFFTKEKVRELKEVFVKAAPIWSRGDTINYLVSAFISDKDMVIGDVLKKMPGIDVKPSGEILYNGRSIQKFYIENMDLLQGRYGIATQNIAAEDIATVQVLENHQPVKALEDIRFSDAAAINLKLKEESKGIFSVMAQLGLGGFPILWNGSLTGTYFSKKRQHLLAYKTNNAGHDLTKELTSFTNNIDFSGGHATRMKMPDPPAINKNRYLHNHSHMFTANNLFKTKNDGELNVNLIYYNDFERRNSYAQSSYLLPGDSMNVIVEDLHSRYATDQLNVELRFNRNENKSYFNNDTHLSGNWERGSAGIVTQQSVTQQFRNPSAKISNILHWVKRSKEEKGFEILSTMGFQTLPQRLSVQPFIYNELFEPDSSPTGVRQQVRTNTLRLDNRISLLSIFKIGNVRLSPQMNLNAYNQEMNAGLYSVYPTGIRFSPADSLRNQLSWTKYTANIVAHISYLSSKLNADIFLPASYNLISIRDMIKDQHNNLPRAYFEPSFSLNYTINTRFELKTNYHFYHGTGNLQTLYTGYILQDYRTLNRYDGHLLEYHGNGGEMNLAYKNVFKMLFAQIGILTDYRKNNILFGQSFNGLLSQSSSLVRPNTSGYLSLNGSLSKGFDWKKLFIKFNYNYTHHTSEQWQQEEIIRYYGNGNVVELSVNTVPVNDLLLTYKATYGENRMKTKQVASLPTIRSLVNELTIDIPLFNKFDLGLSYEHYYNNQAIGNKHFSLADLGVNYTQGRHLYTLTWTNILNTKHYITNNYNGVNSFYSAYKIRPANILLTVNFKLK